MYMPVLSSWIPWFHQNPGFWAPLERSQLLLENVKSADGEDGFV